MNHLYSFWNVLGTVYFIGYGFIIFFLTLGLSVLFSNSLIRVPFWIVTFFGALPLSLLHILSALNIWKRKSSGWKLGAIMATFGFAVAIWQSPVDRVVFRLILAAPGVVISYIGLLLQWRMNFEHSNNFHR